MKLKNKLLLGSLTAVLLAVMSFCMEDMGD